MRLRTLPALLAVPAVLLVALAGCAKTGTSTSGTPMNMSGCPTNVTVTADDNQKTLCVAQGGTVTVNLQSPGGTHWLRIESSGPALSESGTTPSTTRSTAGALFTATRTGESVITSSRPNCPTSRVQTGVTCHSIMAWKVTIDVKA